MDSLYLIPPELDIVNGTESSDLETTLVYKTASLYNDSLQFNDIFNMSLGRKLLYCHFGKSV